MSVFNSSTSGGNGGGGFALNSGAATGAVASGAGGGMAAYADLAPIAWVLFTVMAIFMIHQMVQIGTRRVRRRAAR